MHKFSKTYDPSTQFYAPEAKHEECSLLRTHNHQGTKCYHHDNLAPGICVPVIIFHIAECLMHIFICTAVSGIDFSHTENVTHRHSKLQDIIQDISSKKFCINTCQIINCKTETSILMYMNGCNLNFYSTCMAYIMCPITSQKKASIKS